MADNNLTRIAVFYDGNYFLHVSNYYNFNHERKTRISIAGLHDFVRYQVSQEEDTDIRLCQIVDAHYFRGRLSASEAQAKGNLLYYDRLFDDILMSEGVTTHYLPVKNYGGFKQEKGIDVWLALEAFELAFYKKFSVLVLIASDGDYVPLIRKLNTLGTRVMVLSWDFEVMDEDGRKYSTRTSQELLEEVTYPVAMHEIIDNRIRRNEPLINNLFVPKSPIKTLIKQPEFGFTNSEGKFEVKEVDGGRKISVVLSLKEGFGFIKNPPNNAFFHHSDVANYDFNDLQVGDQVEYTEHAGFDGRLIAKEIRVLGVDDGHNSIN
ncbi:MAG: NYN domain-containing protein [Saprospiraceae bacterium]|nr:NYN domain-containing protein [Saprospiraceae bacterium]